MTKSCHSSRWTGTGAPAGGPAGGLAGSGRGATFDSSGSARLTATRISPLPVSSR